MKLEKRLQLDAPPERVWEYLLNTEKMLLCVPGMTSIQMVSESEYLAHMQLKIAFISAKFNLRTRIVERHAPFYLRAEGTGEDLAIASNLKQSTDMYLAPLGTDQTEMRLSVEVDLVGRLANLGLSAMTTKADRMWDEFGVQFSALLKSEAQPTVAAAPQEDANLPP